MNTDNTPAFKINRMHTGFESYILSIHLCNPWQPSLLSAAKQQTFSLNLFKIDAHDFTPRLYTETGSFGL
jgi:hypothetical protein